LCHRVLFVEPRSPYSNTHASTGIAGISGVASIAEAAATTTLLPPIVSVGSMAR
jgi:hypothetical protein